MKIFEISTLTVFLGLCLLNIAHVSAQSNGANVGSDTATDEANDAYFNNETPTAMAMVGEEEELPFNETYIVISDEMEQPCFLGLINATLRISYRVRPEAVEDSYIAMSDIEFPEPSAVTGECGEGIITVNYDWDNSTFQVNLNFMLNEMDPEAAEEENATATWMLTDIEIHFDLSNEDAFPGSKESQVITVSRHELDLFETPSDHTMMCDKEINVQVGQDEPGVNLIFNHVELAAFGVETEEFPELFVECEDKSFMRPDDDIVVPLIVACSLSLVVILVVIAYAVSRKIQEMRDQTQYKPMP